MKYVISRFNHNLAWLADYSSDYVLYDRSPKPLPGAIVVRNWGSDIYDKLTFIIDNYDHLPAVAVYTKANIFDYIKPREFELIKDNQTFTPILGQFYSPTNLNIRVVKDILSKLETWAVPEIVRHRIYSQPDIIPYSYYKDGLYWEFNSYGFINSHPLKNEKVLETLPQLLGITEMDYVPFAPGSNYIVPRENILKHPKQLYEQIRSYLDWDVYPGEAMIVERGLYTLWN